MAPMGDSRLARFLQGGGVKVDGGGLVTVDSCTITGNTAYYVRAHAPNFPSPPWETHVCLLFAGRRYLCRIHQVFRNGHDNIFLDLREYS